MSEDEQRIAIAESVGYRIVEIPTGIIVYKPNETAGFGYCAGERDDPKILEILPDYLNDLNAMHEAEKILIKQGFQDKWLDELVEVVVGANVHWSDYHCFPQVNRATADQRAEAFLKTIGKWEGGSDE